MLPGLDRFLDRLQDSPQERAQVIERLLGPLVCRQLNVFAIPKDFKLSVVIPVYNEKNCIREIVRRVENVPIPKEIILVEDCSTDGTRDILKEMERQHGLKVIYHEHNQGKGAAMRTGFGHATGTVILVQDADLEYDPAEYPRLIQPIVENKADVVYGSRFIGDCHRVLYFWHSIGNTWLTLLSNIFTNLNLTDMETCYKVFRKEVLSGVKLSPIASASSRRSPPRSPGTSRSWRVFEVPISYSGRTYEEGKKIGLKDAFRVFYSIIRFWLFD